MNAMLAALGQQPDASLLPRRIPASLQTILITAAIFGGQEEPGWRRLALGLVALWVLRTHPSAGLPLLARERSSRNIVRSIVVAIGAP